MLESFLNKDHPAYGCFWLDIQTTCVFSFSKNVVYPNQTFLRLDFSLFSLSGFDEVLSKLFKKQLGLGPSPQSCLYFKISRAQSRLIFVQCSDQINEIWVYSSHFSAFVIDILFTVVKDQSSFYEIRSLAICINIKAFNRVNRKQFNILKTLLEYLENYVFVYWRWFAPKSCLTNYVLRASSS